MEWFAPDCARRTSDGTSIWSLSVDDQLFIVAWRDSPGLEDPINSADKNGVTLLIAGSEELFERLPVAIYRSAPDGSLLAGNPALATLLGFTSIDEMIEWGQSVESVYVDPSRRELWLNQISENGEVHDFDVEFRKRDGSTVWVQDTARATFDDEGNLAYCDGALIDVTEKVRAKKARDEFVATVSHELRNPMSVILGLTQELANDYGGFSDEDREDIVKVLARQAEDASWIIDDLLVAYREDMSRLAIDIETFDVKDEISRALEGMDMDVPVELATDKTDALADPRRTRQILRNLLSNAVRYGGNEIRIKVRRTNGSVELLVCDSGEPLDPAEAERIFKSYERGTGLLDSRSVGLGLAVARKLAGLMNGYLVYEHDGEFSTFVVTLPAAT